MIPHASTATQQRQINTFLFFFLKIKSLPTSAQEWTWLLLNGHSGGSWSLLSLNMLYWKDKKRRHDFFFNQMKLCLKFQTMRKRYVIITVFLACPIIIHWNVSGQTLIKVYLFYSCAAQTWTQNCSRFCRKSSNLSCCSEKGSTLKT